MYDAASSHAIFGVLMLAMFLTLVFSIEQIRFKGPWQAGRLWIGLALAIGAVANIAMVISEKASLPMWAGILALVGCGFGLSAALLMVVGALKARN